MKLSLFFFLANSPTLFNELKTIIMSVKYSNDNMANLWNILEFIMTLNLVFLHVRN